MTITFTDDITTNAGWTIVNGVGQILIDDPSFPDRIHTVNLLGGGGTQERFAHKTMGVTLNPSKGGIILECKYNFISRHSSFPQFNTSGRMIAIQPTALHANDGGAALHLFLSGNPEVIVARYDDGVLAAIATPSIANPLGQGDRFYTITLFGTTLTLNIYSDSVRTIHVSGSPSSVDIGSLNKDIDFLVVTAVHNEKSSGTARAINCDLDDLLASQTEGNPILRTVQIRKTNRNTSQIRKIKLGTAQIKKTKRDTVQLQ